MRQLIFAALAAASFAIPFGVQASPKHTPKPAAAPSAGSYAAPVSYRAATLGKGYTARERHMANCLASVPGYDPTTDRVRLSSGAERRCPL